MLAGGGGQQAPGVATATCSSASSSPATLSARSTFGISATLRANAASLRAPWAAQRDEHERLDGEADVLGRHDGAHTLDHARGPQPLNAAQRRGGRQADAAGELDVRDVPRLLQMSEEHAINLVDGHGHPTIIAPTPPDAQPWVAPERDRAEGGRMQTITHDTVAGTYAPTADYAHAIELRGAQRLLFSAGTMGLDPAGAAGASLDEQLALVWANLRAILAAADMTVDDVVRVTSYLRDGAYAEANARARVAALGGRRIPTTAIVVGTLAGDWLVELEIVAAA